MNKSKIDWGVGQLYTWNVVTGCKRGCSYCYARRIHERFNKTPFNEIKFHPYRMDDLLKLPHPKTVFVGSMSDIEYWDRAITEHIISEISRYPKTTFMFLSKNPQSYYGFNWPINTMQGLTMTCQQSESEQIELHTQMSIFPRPFLSVEPLLSFMFYNGRLDYYEKVIVGAMTGHGAVPVKPEWIQSIKDNVPADKIFWKSSIKGEKMIYGKFDVITKGEEYGL